MHRIKVFQMNDNEYWAGETLEQVIKAFLKAYPEDPIIDTPYEVEALWVPLLAYEEGELKEINFQERLSNMIKNGTKFPCLFAYAD